MNKIFKQLSMSVAAVAALTTSALAAEGTVEANNSTLRLRAEANTSAAILANLPDKTVVDVTAVTEGGWFQVQYDNKTGYVSGDFLSVGAEDVATLPLIKDPFYAVVAEGPLNVRAEASTDSVAVNILGAGSVITVINDELEGWYQTEEGYLSSQYLTVISAEEATQLKTVVATASASSTGSAVADYAMQFQGSRYVYGGTSPSGFDCSGFVQYVYKNMGYSINRTSSAQYSNGVAVSKANLQAGDILFFAKNGVTINHVGLYIGNGQFIHASTPSTGVIVSSLSSTYYTNTYYGARRIV